MMGLIGQLRSLTEELRTAAPRTPERQRLEQLWDDKLFEILHQPFAWLAQDRQDPGPEVGAIAREIVDTLGQISEYRIGRDHVGNRRYDDARRNAVARFVGFAKAITTRRRNR